MILAALAVYGIFFTSLPEQLRRQYQADIADAREQLTELRQERSKLSDQIAAAKDEVQQLQAQQIGLKNQISSVTEQLTAIQDQKAQLEKEILALQKQRKLYRGYTASTFLAFFGIQVNEDLDKLKKDLAVAGDIIEVPKWFSAEMSFEQSIQNLSAQARVEAIRRHLSQGDIAETERKLRIGAFSRSLTKEDIDAYVKQARQRTIHVAQEGPITGRSLIDKYFTRERFAALYENDWKDLKLRMDAFEKRHADVLDRSLRVIISENSSTDEVSDQIRVTTENFDAFSKLMDKSLIDETLNKF